VKQHVHFQNINVITASQGHLLMQFYTSSLKAQTTTQQLSEHCSATNNHW